MREQRGVSIVELMMSMLLGSMVIIGVVTVFSANRQSFRMQDSMAYTQETGTFALDFINHDLMQAGFGGDQNADNVAFDWANSSDGGTSGNDVLAVVYDPSVSNRTYCNGDNAGAATRISSRYWVNANKELVCQGAALSAGGAYTLTGAPQVLVDNVESFQVMYGIDNAHSGCPSGLGAPSMYVVASLVQAAIARAKAACTSPGQMDQARASAVVRTVRVGLLLRTQNQVGATVAANRTYTVLDQVIGAPNITPDDGRVRRLFTKTIMLRNGEATLSL